MRSFLKKIGFGFLKLAAAFVLLAVMARFVPAVNWLIFQKNEHDRVFFTMLETEKAIQRGDQYDVLVFGSSTCENAIDPYQFEDLTGLRMYKFVTGAQTIDMSVELARFLVPKLGCKYVIVDGYPRFGGELTDEGVERILINAPKAQSPLALTALGVDPSSPTTDFLWLARAIGTSIKPYDERDIVPQPWEFTMVGPGFSIAHSNQRVVPGPYFEEPLMAEAVEALNLLQADLSKQGIELIVIVPPLQNARIKLAAKADFPTLEPAPRPDTCFFDGKHLRKSCVNAYSYEIATRFNAYRATKGILPQTCDSLR